MCQDTEGLLDDQFIRELIAINQKYLDDMSKENLDRFLDKLFGKWDVLKKIPLKAMSARRTKCSKLRRLGDEDALEDLNGEFSHCVVAAVPFFLINPLNLPNRQDLLANNGVKDDLEASEEEKREVAKRLEDTGIYRKYLNHMLFKYFDSSLFATSKPFMGGELRLDDPVSIGGESSNITRGDTIATNIVFSNTEFSDLIRKFALEWAGEERKRIRTACAWWRNQSIRQGKNQRKRVFPVHVLIERYNGLLMGDLPKHFDAITEKVRGGVCGEEYSEVPRGARLPADWPNGCFPEDDLDNPKG